MIRVYQLPLGPIQTNCYLVGCEETGEAVVIDPSWSGAEIARFAGDEDLSICLILLTHSHFDHVGGLAELRRHCEAPIACHQEAAASLRDAPTLARLWGIPFEEPPPADRLIADGEILSAGNIRLQAIYTPGHAPGHLSFYVADNGILFDGDVLFQGSIGRTDLPGANHAELMETIRTKLLVLPDPTQVLSGHGPATTIGAERRQNPFLRDLSPD